MTRTPVPRVARLMDLAGLLLLLAGGGLYLRAYLGLRALQHVHPAPGERPFSAMRRFDQLWTLSRAGLGLIVAGVVVMVAATLVARRLRGQAENEEKEESET